MLRAAILDVSIHILFKHRALAHIASFRAWPSEGDGGEAFAETEWALLSNKDRPNDSKGPDYFIITSPECDFGDGDARKTAGPPSFGGGRFSADDR